MNFESMTILAMVACSGEGHDVAPTVPVRTQLLTAGPAWDPTLPPEGQDLADHFAEVADRFTEGQLLAYGPYLDDGRGLYIYDAVEADDDDTLLASDPAIASGVLALDVAEDWDLWLEALDAPTTDPLYVLDAAPGASWQDKVPLVDQDLADHFTYIEGRFADGEVLAGGPVGDEAGRYIVAAVDAAAVDALVAADPGVTSGILEVTIHPWGVLDRQGPR